MVQMTAWSFSRWLDYEQCPRKAKLKHIDKKKEPPNKAMERGTSIHSMAEDFVSGKLKKLPKELELYKAPFAELKKQKAKPEVEVTLNIKWQPTTWTATDAWLRLKIDVEARPKPEVLRLIDHKTGKEKEIHRLQLELYGLVGMTIYPEVKTVDAELWYLDIAKDPVRHTFTRDELADIKRTWMKRITPMLNDARFAPRPGYYCKWCHFSKANGGECEF